MGLFGKSKYDPDEGHNNNLFSDDDDDILSIRTGSEHGFNGSHRQAPHALTVDEVAASVPEEIKMTKTPTAESVYDRLKEHRKDKETALDDNYVPSWAAVNIAAESTAPEVGQPEVKPEIGQPVINPPHTVSGPMDFILSSADDDVASPEEKMPVMSSPFLERCRVAADLIPAEQEELTAETPVSVKGEIPDISEETAAESILGNAAKTILSAAAESATVSSANIPSSSEENSEGFSFDMGEAVRSIQKEIIPEAPAQADDSAAEINAVISNEECPDEVSDTVKETALRVEIIPEESSGQIMHTISLQTSESKPDPALAGDTVTVPEPDVKVYGKIVHGALHATGTDGSDINMTRVINTERKNAGFGNETVMFGSVKPIGASAKESNDFTFTDDDFSESDFYGDGTDDDTYYDRPDKAAEKIADYSENANAIKLFEKYEKEHSSAVAQAVLSFVLAAITVFAALPSVHLFSQRSAGMFSLFVLIAAAIINGSVFKDLSKLFTGKPGFDSCSALTLIAGIVQTAVCVLKFDGKYAGTAAAVTVMLAVGSVARGLKAKRILNGLKQIAAPGEKTAIVCLDGNTSASVAKYAVEDEALAVAGVKTENIHNYLRQSAYLSPFDLKAGILIKICLAVSLAGAVIFGLIASDLGVGLCSLTLLLCTCFPASAALTAELPMYLASSELAEKGACLSGFKGAHDIDRANTVAVSGTDLFPEGSISLYSMKPLSSHDVGNSIIDAAAVAAAAGSPFAPLFIKMLDSVTGESLPKVDGCQYEDKMGISGWIGERTVLIGNRNLMQGHNIPVPSSSVDQKIMHAGYFPVYIACDGVPCLLLIVKYDTDPSVARELGKLCATGMTVVADPRDPNMSDKMLADYFGLPDDAIRIMHNTGRFAYHKSTSAAKSVSASACYRGSVSGFFATVTAAINLPGAISAIRGVTALASGIGIAALIWFCTTGKAELVSSLPIVAFQLLFTLLTLAVAKLKR